MHLVSTDFETDDAISFVGLMTRMIIGTSNAPGFS